MSLLTKEMGGSRPWLYACPVAAIVAAVLLPMLLVPDYSAQLRASGDRLASVTARHYRLTKLKTVSTDEARLALARAFADGEALGRQVRPSTVLHGSTSTHTVDAPPEVGPISLTSEVSAAIVYQPADGLPYAKGTVTTHLILPKFTFTADFTEPVTFDTAVMSDRSCPSVDAGPPPPNPRTQAGTRSLVGVDGGLVLGAASAGYELGGRLYPRKLAYAGRLGEVRLGAYARVEQGTDLKVAAGASLLFGVGRTQ